MTTGLELVLFADWHGDGTRQNADDPLIEDGILELNGKDGRRTIQADNDGRYRSKNVIVGQEYHLSFGDEFLKKNPYRFISLSDAAFTPVRDGHDFTPRPEELQMSLGLVVGPLTLPFLKGTHLRGKPGYVDLDPGPGMRNWMGQNEAGHDNHYGTDWAMPEGEAIVAPAPGIVIEAEGNWPNVSKDPNLGLWDDGNRVTINHGRVWPYPRDFYTIYCHLKKILCSVGQRVNRGQKIAESGNTGHLTTAPHLHFQCGGFGWNRVDPYRELKNPTSICYWTKDNAPQYPLS